MMVRSKLLAGVAAVLALPGIASACVQPSLKASFDLHALQSRLMVVALSCRGESQDSYDALVTRFRGDLAGAYRQVSDHLRRLGGNRKVEQYVADLANVYARESSALGAEICDAYRPLWTRLAEAQGPEDLNRVAAGLPEQPLLAMQVCPVRQPPGQRSASRVVSQQVAASQHGGPLQDR